MRSSSGWVARRPPTGALAHSGPCLHRPAAGVDLVVACDVETRSQTQLRCSGRRRGDCGQIRLLTARLERLVDVYRSEHGADVADVVGGGAAGGLAGGLVAAGARLESGAALIADAVDLYDKIEDADLVVTGEGRVDATSFDGKVVGAVIELAAAAECDVLVIGGRIDDDARHRLDDLGVAWVDLRRRSWRDDSDDGDRRCRDCVDQRRPSR